MKKIAIITPFLSHGGLEKVAVTMSEYLKDFYEIDLIVFDTFNIDFNYTGNLIDLKVPFYNRTITKRLKSLYLIYKKLSSINHHYDLFIFHGELSYIAGFFLKETSCIVVIHENRFSAKKDHQAIIFHKIAKWIYRDSKIKKIITVSEGIKNKFIENYNIPLEKIETIYNPFNIKSIKELASEPLLQYEVIYKDKDVFINVGRLSFEKGQKFLIQIFKEYKKLSKKKTSLVFIGDGKLKVELINYSKSLNLKTYQLGVDNLDNEFDIYFLEFQKNPFKFIHKSQVLIMSSFWEGFGNTIVESMACRTPVISTDCESGPREIISPKSPEILDLEFGEYGILLPKFGKVLSENDIKMWIKAFTYLLNNQDLYNKYVQKSLKRANDFDISIIMSQWNKTINQSLEGKLCVE